MQLEFTVTADQRLQCVVYSEVLVNDSMNPYKLKQYLENKHAIYFQRNLGLYCQHSTITIQSTVSKQNPDSSYLMVKRISKLVKTNTIAVSHSAGRCTE